MSRASTEFLNVNGVREQPLHDAEVMEILEYGVPAAYHRQFTVQGFDPLTQGLKKFIEFCSQLESCELTMEKPIPKKVSFTDKTVRQPRLKNKCPGFLCNTDICIEKILRIAQQIVLDLIIKKTSEGIYCNPTPRTLRKGIACPIQGPKCIHQREGRTGA